MKNDYIAVFDIEKQPVNAMKLKDINDYLKEFLKYI